VLGVVGDDPGDERLERLVPAVLLRVERAVALDDPAEVPRTGWPEDERSAAR
jgi:hypothetical protein